MIIDHTAPITPSPSPTMISTGDVPKARSAAQPTTRPNTTKPTIPAPNPINCLGLGEPLEPGFDGSCGKPLAGPGGLLTAVPITEGVGTGHRSQQLLVGRYVGRAIHAGRTGRHTRCEAAKPYHITNVAPAPTTQCSRRAGNGQAGPQPGPLRKDGTAVATSAVTSPPATSNTTTRTSINDVATAPKASTPTHR